MKHSATGVYGRDLRHLDRQLEGIRYAIRDGRMSEFFYVTNGVFSEAFAERVDQTNLALVKDYLHESPRVRASIDPTSLRTMDDTIRNLVRQHHIPQVDLVEHVRYPGS